MNVILFLETEDHKLQLTTFQILLLDPTGLENLMSDGVYKTKISLDIENQCQLLSNYLLKLKLKLNLNSTP